MIQAQKKVICFLSKKYKVFIYCVCFFVLCYYLYSVFFFNPVVSETNNRCKEYKSHFSFTTKKFITIFKPEFITIFKPEFITIFKPDGSKQCDTENKNISIKFMENQLKNIGIKVFKSVKGKLKYRRVIATCGAPTSNINIFYITWIQKQLAIKNGFSACSK